MEIGGTQNTRDDRTAPCRSFGSNYQPCSQSRKISIGIFTSKDQAQGLPPVGSLNEWRPKTTKENEALIQNAGKTSRKLTSVSDTSGRNGPAKAESKRNQIDQEHKTSPWVTTKSIQSRNQTSEAAPHPKPSKETQTGGSELSRSNVENPGNQKTGMQSNGENLKKFNRVYSRRDVEEEGEREGAKGFASETAQEVTVEDKAIEPEGTKQVLRMKLWEILGTNPSSNKQAPQAPSLSGNKKNSEEGVRKREAAAKPKQNSDTIESDSQSPDHTIKRAVTRSSTRKKAAPKAPTTKTRKARATSTRKSLGKNIFSSDGQLGKVDDAVNGGSPKSNEKSLRRKGSKVEARTIDFNEERNAGDAQRKDDQSKATTGPGKTSSTGNSMRSNQKSPLKSRSLFGPEKENKENGSSLFSAMNKEETGCKRDAYRFGSPEKLISDEVQPAVDISKTVSGANKTSSIGSKFRSYQNLAGQSSSRLFDTKIVNLENSSSLSSTMKKGKKDSKAEGGSKSFPEKENVEEHRPAAGMKKTAKDVETSSIGKRTRIYGTSPPENNSKFVDLDEGDGEKSSSLSAAKKKSANMSFLGIPHRWAQHDDFGTSPFKMAAEPHVDLQSPTFGVRTPAETLSPASPPEANHGELNDQSSEDCSFHSPLASKPDNYYTPGTGKSNDTEEDEDCPLTKSAPTMNGQDAEDAKYRSSPEKMDSESSKEDWAYPDIGTEADPGFVLYPNKRLRFSPILASPKGLEESDEYQGPLEEDGENGLANAVSLLALALRRVQSKIKKATSKKSSEVLMSVAEEVHLQLQNAESQFERDVGKLASISKSKRKHLETETEEQQMQLNLIYQKFKEDISQYIQEHRSKVEGLEGQEKDLRLFMEKRKASQKEVLKQMEESIQGQLNDAETKIAAVHKVGREKILQLKQVLSTCLKEFGC